MDIIAFIDKNMVYVLINNELGMDPTKRIISVCTIYMDYKPIIGSMIAHEIGIDELKKSCRHFNERVTRLEQL